MARRSNVLSFPAVAARWQRDARTLTRTAELATAAGTVVAARTARMVAGAGDPNFVRDPEMRRMVTEKMLAATAAQAAMAPGASTMNAAATAWWSGQVEASVRLVAELTAARSPVDVMKAQLAWWQRSGEANLDAVWSWGGGLSRAAGAGLTPIHRTATANARRLG